MRCGRLRARRAVPGLLVCTTGLRRYAGRLAIANCLAPDQKGVTCMEYEDLKAAQQARANRLRDRIAKLKSGSGEKHAAVKTPIQFAKEKTSTQLDKDA